MLIHRCDCYPRTLSCSLLCLFSQVIPRQAMVHMHRLLSASMGGARILILGARRASAISTSPERGPATAFSCRHFWSNGRNQKSGGELTILRFNSRKAVCLLKASSSAKKNVSNSGSCTELSHVLFPLSSERHRANASGYHPGSECPPSA